MAATSFFTTYTRILAFSPCGCAAIIGLQIASDRAAKNDVHKTKYTQILLYCVYIAAAICASVGFSLHTNSNNAIWCEVWGVPTCLGMYGTEKAIIYLFFFNRAKLANGMITNKYLRHFFAYISKVYVFLYWMVYVALANVFFSFKMTEDSAYSHCVFDETSLWFLITAACVDMLNCVLSVSLFLYPLIKASIEIKLTNADHASYMEQLGFISIMKWNVSLSAVTVLTSVATILSIHFAHHFMWAFCLFDPLFNSICIFCMHGTNRRFIRQVLCGRCGPEDKTMPTKKPHLKTARSASTTTAGSSQNTSDVVIGSVASDRSRAYTIEEV
eukprot:15613_1